MTKKSIFGYSTESKLNFEETTKKTLSLLQEEGFGLLTQIDVKAKMKEKINKDMDNYVILGVCNPALAAKALDAEIEIGLLLPCNVIIYEKEGKVFASAVMPKQMMSMLNKKALCEVAETAEQKFKKVIDKLSECN